MKTLLFAISISFIGITAYSQKDTTLAKFNDEISINVSPLIQNIFKSSSIPNYAIGYRHYFKTFALRAGIGGNFGYIKEIEGEYASNFSRLNSRIGIEFFTLLGEKSTLYYGVDLSYSFNQNIQSWQNHPDYNNRSSINHTCSVSPLLGYRFMFNDRIGLGAYTKLNFNISNILDNVSYDDPIYDSNSNTVSSGINFSPPTSIFLLIRI